MTKTNEIDYRKLFASSPVPAFILKYTGDDMILFDFNDAATQIIKKINPDNLNQSIRVIFSDFPDLRNGFQTAFCEKKSFVTELMYQPDIKGKSTYLQFRAAFVEPYLLMVNVQSIHRRRRAESDLKENKERLELAMLATGSGIWDWYVKTGQVVFGDQWAAILGYTPDEIEPHISSWEKLIHPDDKQRVFDRLNRHMSGELPRYKSEHRLRGKDGNWVWVLDVGRIVERAPDQTPIRMTGTKVDISKQKKMELALELLNKDLEKRIENRTRKLEQNKKSLLLSREELQRKSKHLMEVNNALKVLLRKSDENKKEMEDNMLANINELVAPYLEKIQNRPLSETQKMYMQIIKTNLNEIVSPFSRKLISKYYNLTPAELTVADLIKHGKTTKEIASLLCLSEKTISTQRKNIRKKIKINQKKVNLRSYLYTFQE